MPSHDDSTAQPRPPHDPEDRALHWLQQRLQQLAIDVPTEVSPDFHARLMARVRERPRPRKRLLARLREKTALWAPVMATAFLLLLSFNAWQAYQALNPYGSEEGVFPFRTRGSQDSAIPVAREVVQGDQFVTEGKYAQAQEAYQNALRLASERRNSLEEARVRVKLGAVYQHLKQYPLAHEQLRQALQTCQNLGDKWEEAKILEEIGDMHQAQGAYPQALDVYQQALKMFREVGNSQGEEMLQGKLGPVYQALGQPTHALHAYESQLKAAGRPTATILRQILPLYHTSGDYSRVVNVATALLVLEPSNAAAYRYRGLASKALGNREQARQDLQRAAQSGDTTAQDALRALEGTQ